MSVRAWLHDQLGRGVSRDDNEAVAWYRKAADQGDVSAQANLGIMYFEGRGVPQDYEQAASWARKASDNGNAAAQENLAVAFDHGWGVAKDLKQGFYWHQKSAQQGFAQAQNSVGVAYLTGTGTPRITRPSRVSQTGPASVAFQDDLRLLATRQVSTVRGPRGLQVTHRTMRRTRRHQTHIESSAGCLFLPKIGLLSRRARLHPGPSRQTPVRSRRFARDWRGARRSITSDGAHGLLQCRVE